MQQESSQSRLGNRVQELEKELRLLEPVVERARLRARGLDEEWNEWKERTIVKICKEILKVKTDDPPSKAVAIINRLHSDCAEIEAPDRLIADYDQKKSTLLLIRQEYKSYLTSVEKAQKAYEDLAWKQAIS
jgi:hypothetical protein